MSGIGMRNGTKKGKQWKKNNMVVEEYQNTPWTMNDRTIKLLTHLAGKRTDGQGSPPCYKKNTAYFQA